MSDIMQAEMKKQAQKWPMVRLGDLIVQDVGGISFKRDQFTDSGTIVVPKKAISSDVNIDHSNLVYTSKKTAIGYENYKADNSFLITTLRDLVPTGPNLGRICEINVSEPFLLAQGVYAFKLNELVCPKFITYYSNSIEFREQLLRSKVGSTQVHIRSGDFKAAKIPLPPLKEQKRIAAILDKADAIRRKRQQAIKLADDFLRAVFLDMFGDPVTNPKGWEVKPLSELIAKGDKLNYGVVQPGDNVEDGVPLIRSGDLGDTGTDINSIRKVSTTIDEKHRKSRLKGNEILIACVGSIGKVGWVNESMIGWNIARAVTRIPLSDDVNREYVYRYLQSPVIQGYFQRETRAVAQPTLNVGLIGKTPIALPPKELQEEFLKIFSNVGSIKRKSSGSVTSDNELFSSLSQKAFAGEL